MIVIVSVSKAFAILFSSLYVCLVLFVRSSEYQLREQDGWALVSVV